MDWASLSDDERRALWIGVGCTFEDCDTGDDPWVAIEGKLGTPAEGTLSVLCETHFKQMCSLPSMSKQVLFMAKVGHVDIVDLGVASDN